MVHLIYLVEGYSDGLRRFEEQWNGKLYANGKAKLRVREVKLYSCSVNERGREECVRDFMHLCGSHSGGHENDGQYFAWGKLKKYMSVIGRMLGLKPVDDSKLKPLYGDNPYLADKAIPAHFISMGEVKDPRVLKEGQFGHLGEEIV